MFNEKQGGGAIVDKKISVDGETNMLSHRITPVNKKRCP